MLLVSLTDSASQLIWFALHDNAAGAATQKEFSYYSFSVRLAPARETMNQRQAFPLQFPCHHSTFF
jgi:hypothetical protein